MLKRLTLLLYFGFSTAMSSQPVLGGWMSGGGKLLGYEGNPWFLQNTNHVTYCIKIDERNISADYQTVRTKVHEAIAYWKEQFRYAEYLDRFRGVIDIATQTFLEEDCRSQSISQALRHHDMVFQLGALNWRQRLYLKDPRKHVGISVMTDYDKVRLRGKGFVYLSADRGPMRYLGDQFIDDAWSAAGHGILLRVLIHELGHVFGVPHIGTDLNVMGAGYPALMLHRSMSMVLGSYRLQNIFKPLSNFRNPLPPYDILCGIGDRITFLKTYLEIDPGVDCLEFRKDDDKIKILVQLNRDSRKYLAGEISKHGKELTTLTPVVRIGLTARQRVFEDLGPFSDANVLVGPVAKSIVAKGKYTNATSGLERNVVLRMSPGDLDIGGVLDGEYILSILENPQSQSSKPSGVAKLLDSVEIAHPGSQSHNKE